MMKRMAAGSKKILERKLNKHSTGVVNSCLETVAGVFRLAKHAVSLAVIQVIFLDGVTANNYLFVYSLSPSQRVDDWLRC